MGTLFVARLTINSAFYFPHPFCKQLLESPAVWGPQIICQSPKEGFRSNPVWNPTFPRRHLWGSFRKKASKGSLFWPRFKRLTAKVIKIGKGGGGGKPDNSKLRATNDWEFSKLIYLFHPSTFKFKPYLKSTPPVHNMKLLPCDSISL